MTGRAINET